MIKDGRSVETLWISGTGVRVAVLPAYGARVTSLVDLRTGRDWIAPGPPSPETGDDAPYLAAEAVGWDECFPNVDRFAAGAPWSRMLRDHGVVWGRPWTVTDRTPDALATCFDDPLFSLTRRLSCTGAAVAADYALVSRSALPLPFLWAMHLLLAVEPGDRIEVPGVESVAVGYLSEDSEPPPSLAWPDPGPAVGFPLDVVQDAGLGFAAKLYAEDVAAGAAALHGAAGSLRIRWQAPWSSLGIWLNYGGWPDAGTVHHVALEPTTRPTGTFAADSPVLAPGQRLAWRVELAVGEGTHRRGEL